MPDQNPHVFLDPTGVRAKRLRIAAALVAVFAIGLLIAFGYSVMSSPRLSIFGASTFPQPTRLHKPAAKLAAARKALFSRIQADRRRIALGKLSTASEIRGAYFAPWRDTGLESFRAHAADLTHIYPAWISLRGDGRGLITDFWQPDRSPTTKDLVQIANANGVRIIPVVSNAQAGVFDTVRLRRMLNDANASKDVARQLADFVRQNGYAGLQVDFEDLDAGIIKRLAPWLSLLGAQLHKQGEELSVTLETRRELNTRS
jgi:hypothetical protein